MFVDLAITNANTQLTPLTGYLEKYGGYPLKKGRVSTSLRYHIEGKALQAENKIQVDQLTLGARNNSPDATSLPLKLGVALLKDSNGRIELDVPVSGRLDDPEFSLGPIVLKIIVNMIVKAAASPFKLLGALVGGGGDELSFVEFTPGTTNLVEGELDKLGKLTAALAKRPALNLEIEGAIDPESDRDALAKQKLREQLKAKRLQELTAKGRAPESVETFQIEPEEQRPPAARRVRRAVRHQHRRNHPDQPGPPDRHQPARCRCREPPQAEAESASARYRHLRRRIRRQVEGGETPQQSRPAGAWPGHAGTHGRAARGEGRGHGRGVSPAHDRAGALGAGLAGADRPGGS